MSKAGHLDGKPVVLLAHASLFVRKPVILGREGGDLLLGEPGADLSLVPLLFTKLHSVAPETGRGVLTSVTHPISPSGHALLLHGHHECRAVAAVRQRSRSSRSSERRPRSASSAALRASMVVLSGSTVATTWSACTAQRSRSWRATSSKASRTSTRPALADRVSIVALLSLSSTCNSLIRASRTATTRSIDASVDGVVD